MKINQEKLNKAAEVFGLDPEKVAEIITKNMTPQREKNMKFMSKVFKERRDKIKKTEGEKAFRAKILGDDESPK